MVLQSLNVFFLMFHTALIFFNVLGWVWKKTRLWNLGTLIATAVSWFVMGLWHGIGYCVCTDWHFQICRAMGIHDPEDSYIDFLIRCMTGHSPDPQITRTIAGWVFAVALICSVGLNVRDYLARKRAS